MTKKMLIDATHSEETRVAVVDGNRLVDFDYESAVRKQLKGSIFLAKVTRVEPSLQAAFVNFGGNRHGFLPFTEIHPDYFRIPIADREALIAEQEREMEARRREEEAEDSEDADEDDDEDHEDDEAAEDSAEDESEDDEEDAIGNRIDEDSDDADGNKKPKDDDADGNSQGKGRNNRRGRGGRNRRGGGRNNNRGRGRKAAGSRKVEVVGGDAVEGDQPVRPTMRRNYKIQEVVKRGQIMLVQVSKEERGNKGAAVSTYLSLPGRYCVLMPNSPRGGGVSRKIANFKERKRMREILKEFNVPQGMSVIMRTAGVSRTKTEIKRDLDYLMKLWDSIRELTLESTAPALVHEEGNLVRRSIRDIYSRDIDEVIVAGDDGYKFARDFMKMMIPSHVKKVNQYKDEKIPLFHRYQVENQISEIGEPIVTLPAGGYLVINPTEALVSVDVNSGKATKERHIEETALRTNLEAAEEVARQLRLRDLGGLVVVDFIDMEDRRNNRKVENKMKDALSGERARIQIGRISNFGLMELSRQRLNPSLTEAQYEKCPHCEGIGNVRTIDAAAIMALRALEEEGIRERSQEVILHIPNEVALYLLNNKRHRLAEIEERYGFTVTVKVDQSLAPSRFIVEPVKSVEGQSDDEDTQSAPQQQAKDEQKPEGGRRRRGRRGGRRRRGRDRDQDRDEESSESGDAKDEKEDKKEDKKEAKADKEGEASEKKPRKRVAKSKKDEDKKESKSEKKSDKADEKDAKTDAKKDDGKEDSKARKKPARKSAAKSKKDDTPKDKDADSKGSKSDDKVADVAAAKPSNDAQPVSKDYEVVNDPPAKKKKGWWSKK